MAFPPGTHPVVSGSDDGGCLEVVQTVYYPAPVDWHFASLTLFATFAIAGMVVWLWLKYRREGARRY